ncbi:AEC family transporter [Spiroplasma endosymbiont of Panorpa germanica]|uniref:AEC family transporter n=1 Tax=Spiroplasma endosymbiont of Panorpa germanica TaxID=3066314 RepID=UPI0030CD2CE9
MFNILLSNNSITDALKTTLVSWSLWSAIIATISVIGLGFFLTVKGFLNKDWEKAFTRLVMLVGLPSLALNGFLKDVTPEELKSELSIIMIGFIFYLVMTMGAKIFFYKYNKDIQDTLAMCIALGSTTFFGIPLITAIYGKEGATTANNFNIPYRIFLYSLGFSIMSKKNIVTQNAGFLSKKEIKLQLQNLPVQEQQAFLSNQKQIRNEILLKEAPERKKIRNQNLKQIFLNPILIATFLGFFIWATQLIPGIKAVQYDGKEAFSPLRIDLLFPPIKSILDTLAAICTPLAWIAIGMTIAKGNIKKAMKSKVVWYATAIRVLVVPIVALLFVVLFAWIGSASGGWTISSTQLTVILIMAATPPANVVVAYAINYDKESELASNVTTLSTISAIVTMPIWVIIGTAIGATGLFIS